MERSRLHVEGRDDQNSIIHLLIQNGIDFDAKPWPPQFPEVKVIGSVEKLLLGLETAVRDSTGRAIGFVLDADAPLSARWEAVLARLRRVDVRDLPETPPPDGFIGRSDKYNARVGVWLMPDNQREGALEHFLMELIAHGDPLIGHAGSATDTAKQLGALFGEPHRLKAVIHAWLAWQAEPGLPYGTAIRARYFQHASPAAASFVAWFARLYEIPGATR